MAYSTINNDIKQETNAHLRDLLHAQLFAEDDSHINIDNNDSAEESDELPLDFSIKRKSQGYDEVSGSDSVSSPTSSINDTSAHTEDRKSDNDVFININNVRNSQDSPLSRSPHFECKQFKNEQLRRQQSSSQEQIRQNEPVKQGSESGLALPNMLHDLHMNVANANMLASSFPAMAALMIPRKIDRSQKCLRPFKAYPKDPFCLTLENTSIPHYLTSFGNFENSAIMQGLNLSPEEVFNIYNQQLLALRERERYLQTIRLSQEHYSTKTTTTMTSSPSTSSPTSLVSVQISGRNNGINSNLIASNQNGPSASTRATPPTSPGQDSNNSNCSSHYSINKNLSHLTSTPLLTAGSRRRLRSLPDEQKDEAYWERRRKNNEAAKRSRDSRRAKEDQIAIRAAFLEQENLKLRVEIASLKTETDQLRCRLYNS